MLSAFNLGSCDAATVADIGSFIGDLCGGGGGGGGDGYDEVPACIAVECVQAAAAAAAAGPCALSAQLSLIRHCGIVVWCDFVQGLHGVYIFYVDRKSTRLLQSRP